MTTKLNRNVFLGDLYAEGTILFATTIFQMEELISVAVAKTMMTVDRVNNLPELREIANCNRALQERRREVQPI